MSCNNLHILNFNHSVVVQSNGNTIVVTDKVKCNSVTIPQPVTKILQINSPGPQGPPGPSGSGGGGGGTVIINSVGTISGINATATGGTGGSQLYLPVVVESDGPGGGGGGSSVPDFTGFTSIYANMAVAQVIADTTNANIIITATIVAASTTLTASTTTTVVVTTAALILLRLFT